MKIAFIGQKGIPATFGGVEYHVDHLSRELVKLGVSVNVYVRSWYTPKLKKEFNGVKLIHIPTINSKHLDASIHSFLSSIHAIFSKVDIVHYHCIGPAFFSFIPRIFGKKVVITVHRLDWATEKWGRIARFFLRLGELISIKLPHETIVVSKELKEYFINKYNGSDLSYLSHGTDPVQIVIAKLITQKYNIRKHEYLLYLGRLSPEKRVEWVIKAFMGRTSFFRGSGKIKLVIAGGSSSTDNYVKILKKMSAKDLDIIFTGYVKGMEKAELLSNARILVMASYLEGYPIVLMEGKNYGNCCLVSDIPPHLESVTDGVDGVVFNSDSFEDFKNKMSNLMNDPEEINLLGRNARKKMASLPDWADIAGKTIAIYKRTLKSD